MVWEEGEDFMRDLRDVIVGELEKLFENDEDEFGLSVEDWFEIMEVNS